MGRFLAHAHTEFLMLKIKLIRLNELWNLEFTMQNILAFGFKDGQLAKFLQLRYLNDTAQVLQLWL